MNYLPEILAGALLVLAVAFGLHCLFLHCDKKPQPEQRNTSDSGSRRLRSHLP